MCVPQIVIITNTCFRLKELDIPLKYPVEVIDFTDEEGRFGGMLGSMCITGKLKAADIEKMAAADGQMAREALELYGCSSETAANAAYEPGSVKGYVEMHIEQGTQQISLHEYIILIYSNILL